jgi:release factor glutamine methyltransferase
MTLKEALTVSDRTISSREAEIFLQHVLGKERAWLFANDDYALTEDEEKAYEKCIERRDQNEPVSYIIGFKEFYGRKFKTDKRALIPRPETEGIIDLALKWAPPYFQDHTAKSGKPCPVRILEIGTGSGNIAISLALELPKASTPAQIIASEISPDALQLAQENWKILSAEEPTPLSSLKFVEADMFDHEAIRQGAPYDLIAANLPYVPTAWQFDPEAQAEVVFKEPDLALFGGEDGLLHYRAFFKDVEKYLAKDGLILIEYGEDETGDITDFVKSVMPNRTITVHKDYAGLDRILEIK